MGAFLEILRRFGSATADAAAGFLLSEDPSTEREEPEEEEQHSLIDVPADSAEIKEEHVRDSPLDAICEDLAESMDEAGSSHDHGEGSSLAPEIAGGSEGMDHSR
jgi:hypothetical protein